MFSNKTKRIIITTLLICFVFLNFGIPKAQAQIDTGVSGLIVVAFTKVWDAMKSIGEKIYDFVRTEAVGSAIQMFSRQFAKNLATDLASGGEGGKPLFYTRSIGEYISGASETAAGDFIGGLSETSWALLGLNLCDPDLNVKMAIQAALLEEENPLEPKCEWKDIEKNWNEFSAKMSGGGWMEYITFSFEPGKNDISSYLLLSEEVEKEKQEKARIAEMERLKSDWKNVKTAITKELKTTGDLIAEEAKALVPKGVLDIGLQTKWNNAYLSKNILAPFLSTFTNTLIAKLGERFLKKGFWSLSDVVNQSGSYGGGGYGDSIYYTGGYTQAQASAAFGGLLTPNITTIEDFQQLEDFLFCNLSSPTFGNKLNNCVLEPNFYSALYMDPPITLQEAVSSQYGLINGNFELVNPEDSRNQKLDFCYNQAFCYGNLQKLRQSRIIPIGWEIAAARSTNTPVTLQEAMDNFNNPSSPWYRLVDPNWILKAPSAQCRANVYTAVLESSQSNSRHQSCVDPMSCIKEKDDGICEPGAYGRCTKEKNIWRLGGDSCDSWNDTCLSLTKTSDNATDTYITSSMKTCPSEATGCQWYAISSANIAGEWQWQDDQRIYLDDDTKECDAQAGGCSQFIRLTSGTNLLYNASFEIDENNDDVPDGWYIAGSDQYDNQGLNSSMAIKNTTSNQPHYDSSIKIFPNQYYTFSAWAKPIEQSGTLPTPVLFLENQSGNEVGEIISYYGSDAYKAPSNQLKVNADISTGAASVNGWYFLSVTFLSNSNETYPFEVKAYMAAKITSFNDSQSWFDNIQLERSQTPTSYYDYGAVNLAYLKKAPDYYQCQGYTLKIPAYEDEATCSGAGLLWRSDIEACVQGGDPFCSNYALYCQEYEDGCQAYTPVNGDPMIPGIAKPQDYCPQECLGYQTYEEDPSYFDLVENSSALSQGKSLISTTALECSSTELNCEEFTNLDEVAQGGEGKEYYTYLRQCVLPDNANVDPFYTWEGSDTTGFQLKTWDLLGSNQAYPGELGYGPCTNVNIGVPVSQVSCNDTVSTIQICSSTMNDPNCREFFDEQGNNHFRLQERTITASSDCHPFRRTESGLDYTAIPQEGITCSQAAAGCRLYRGNTSSNIKIAFYDDFEDGDTQGWEDGIISNESVYLNDHSLKTIGMPRTEINPSLIANSLNKGKEYQLELIIKKVGSGSTTIAPSLFDGGTDVTYFGNAIVTDDWQQIILGPVELDHNISPDYEALWIMPSDDVYIDSLTLKELNNNLYLIKDSWQTPISCDNPIDNPLGEMGGTSGNRTFIGAMLGCQEYEDSNNNTVYLHSFSELCSEEVVGCEAMIDTHNSSLPFTQSFNDANSSSLDDVTVPEDNYTYIVNNSAMSCFSSEKGCQTLGLPDINQAVASTTPEYIEGYNNINLINNPDEYDSILCLNEELFCQEYKSGVAGEGYSYYSFYDPGERLCEYQINKTVGSTPQTGWFKVNSLDACYGGTDYSLYSSDDSSYEDWVGLCPQEQSGCTKFIDPYASVSDNKIANLGFENDYDANFIPDYYYDSSGLALITYSDTEGLNDSKAVLTIYDSPDLFYQSISLKKDKLYRISVNAKDQNQIEAKLAVADCVGPTFNFNSPDYKFATTTDTAILTLENLTSDYHEYGGQLEVSEDTVCNLYFGGTGSAGAWFDNLSLKEIEPYYYLDNDSLDKQSCLTQTSLKHGCVLFQDTSVPEFYYNVQTSYQNSSQDNEALVNPELCSTGDEGCDANTILKVTRDRACAEWYSCVSSIFITDPLNPSNLKEQCSQLALCNEYSISSSATGKCTNWVVNENPEILSQSNYVNRDVSWGGREYSGYSMYNKYQIDATQVLDTVDFPNNEDEIEEYRLVVVVGEKPNPYQCKQLGEDLGLYNMPDPNNPIHSPLIEPVYANGLCLLGVDGLGLHCTDPTADPAECDQYDEATSAYHYVTDSCGINGICELGERVEPRGYASQESPFPFTAWQGNQQYYDKSNICIESQEAFDYLYNVNYIADNNNLHVLEVDPIYPEDPSDDDFIKDSCETQYKKVEFGNGIKTMYFGEGVDIPLKVTEINQSGTGDIVYAKTKSTNYINWGGYCLEEDSSRVVNGGEQACLTWLPQDIVTGGLDINNLYTSAGYEPGSDEEYMCLQAGGKYEIGKNNLGTNQAGNFTDKYKIQSHLYFSFWDLQGAGSNDCGTISENPSSYPGHNFYVCMGTSIGPYVETVNADKNNFTIDDIEEMWFVIVEQEGGSWSYWPSGNKMSPSISIVTDPYPGVVGDYIQYRSHNTWSGSNGYFIKLWFSTTTRRLEYIYYEFHENSSESGSIVADIYFYLREPCQTIAQVVENGEHYAWTNRVWSQSNYTDQYLETAHISTCTQSTPPTYCDNYPNKLYSPFLEYSYPQQNSPGGMVSDLLNYIGPPNDEIWFIGDNTTSTSPFYNAGSAYSCEGGCSGRMCLGGENKQGLSCTVSDPDCKDTSVIPAVTGVCVGIQGTGGSSAGSLDITDARERVSQLFARAFNVYEWSPINQQYILNNSLAWNVVDESELDGSGPAPNVYHEPPYIFAVNNDGSRVNVAPHNYITVNNFYGTGNIEANEQLMTNIQFYFYSHQSAMPTRKLRIDWGDGSSVIESDGYFQNRYAPNECDGSSYNKQLGKTCVESPYQASHLYSYALAPTSGYECDGNLAGEPIISDAKCFKPRVQITDNWGWCSGGESLTTGNNLWGGYGAGECDDLAERSAKFQGWVVIYQ